jgi:DNA-binding response OmpR family regulator
MRALIIDDSRAMRSILSGILGEAGFDTVAAADAEEALALLESDPGFELALVDWNLPAMSGLSRSTRRCCWRSSPSSASTPRRYPCDRPASWWWTTRLSPEE